MQAGRQEIAARDLRLFETKVNNETRALLLAVNADFEASTQHPVWPAIADRMRTEMKEKFPVCMRRGCYVVMMVLHPEV